ncbi:MAG: acyl-CoA dehydrogenase family protein [Cyanobacteria bacterium]|nr:acyl-CoA dehydrogenase family protein [Cyanobacteriota bacterium]
MEPAPFPSPSTTAAVRPDPRSLMETLVQEFRATAVARDHRGGTPKAERDRIRASGLLSLMIPQLRGGHGATWVTAFDLSRRLARVDASLAHVYSYHNLGVALPGLFGSDEQREHFETATVREGWWWGNALNPLDRRCRLVADGGDYRLQGDKRFCSGSHDAEILPVGAVDSASGDLVVVVVPAEREGIRLHNDWEAIGQRQTDSGSVRFEAVRVFHQEVLGRRSAGASPFQTIRACLTQLNLAHIFVGIAEGSLEEARRCLLGEADLGAAAPSCRSGDPHVIQLFGELWLQLEAATALLEQAALPLQRAWERGPALTHEERAHCAVKIAAAKVAAARAGLEITSRVFELVGARGVSSSLGLDRHWRNLRTLSLHDPDSRKIESLGAWGLHGQLPEPGFYI